MANNLWETRADPIWWTEKERKEAGLQIQNIKSCIECKFRKANFYEKDAPTRLFCDSYCQWIKHTGAPDLRGKTPRQIVEIFSK